MLQPQPRGNHEVQLAIAAAGWPSASNPVAPTVFHHPAQVQPSTMQQASVPQQQLCLADIPSPPQRQNSSQSLHGSPDMVSPTTTPGTTTPAGKSLEDMLDQEVNKAAVGSAIPAPLTVPAPQLPGVGVAKAEPGTVQQKNVAADEVEEVPPTKPKVSAQAALAKLEVALKQRDGDGSTGGDGNQQTAKKKGAQPKSSTMKKPASTSVKAKAKPTSSTMKRPAGKVTTSGSSSKGVLTKKQALRMMPNGCKRCREVPGCTRSCWKKKKYEPDW